MKFYNRKFLVILLIVILFILFISYVCIENFQATQPVVNKVYNIENRALYLYYPFDKDMKNYSIGYAIKNPSYGIEDTKTANLSMNHSTTRLTDKSLQFNGNNEFFKLPALHFMKKGLSVAFWVKLKQESLTKSIRFFDFTNGPNSQRFGLELVNKKLRFFIYIPSPKNNSKTPTVVDTTYLWKDTNWHHVCLNLTDTGNFSIYVDGADINFKYSLCIKSVCYQPVDFELSYIGKEPSDTSSQISGNFNSFLVFNRALTPTEISYLFNNPNSITFDNRPSDK